MSRPHIKTVKHRAALDLAFRGLGGVPALTEWARENQGEFYKLWMQAAKKERQVDHRHTVMLLSPEERDQRLKELLEGKEVQMLPPAELTNEYGGPAEEKTELTRQQLNAFLADRTPPEPEPPQYQYGDRSIG
jgi:hypothetical protein